MSTSTSKVAAWQLRARENPRAASLLAARHPPLPMPAVSRIYYACFQAVCAALRARGLPVGSNHGQTWLAANVVLPGLSEELRELYFWRIKADYATAPVQVSKARELVAHYATLLRQLGITECE